MIYTDAFLTTLRPEGRNILRRGAANMGTIPIELRPGVNGALEGYGLTVDQGAATGTTRSTVLPDATNVQSALRRLHVLIVSGPAAGNTAGLFGLPTVGMLFAASVGWVARWRSAGALSASINRGGDLFGENFAADASFEPTRVVGGFGWVKGSGAASTWVWYNGTPDVLVACTGSAPADDRQYDHVMGVARQNVGGTVVGYALKIDCSSESAPVIADERIFNVPSPQNRKGPEWNRSPRGTGSGGTVSLRFGGVEASLGVESLTG